MIRPSSLPALLLAAASALLLAHAASAQTMYKYIGADGKVVYSDKPPPAGVKFTTIQADTSKTGVELLPRDEEGKPAGADGFDKRYKERKAKEAEHDKLIAQLQKEYDDAVLALERGRDPQDGDRTQNANGTSRQNDAYFARVEALQKKVEDAAARLETARRQ